MAADDAPNINTQIARQTVKASVELIRYEAELGARIRRILLTLQRELIAQINDRAQIRTAFSQKRLEQLLAATDKAIDASYRQVAIEHSAEIKELVRIQSAVAGSIVNTAVGAALVDVTFNATQLKRLATDTLIEGAPSSEWWARQAKSTREKFADNIRQGILRGETVSELVNRVRAPGTGLMTASLRNAQALVRSSVQTAANDVRLAVYKENEDIFDGIQWISTLDAVTTPVCQALDGLVWDNNLNPVGHDITFPGPTAHFGCRSVQIPVLMSFSDLLKDKSLAAKLDKAEAANPGTRASINGQVSAKTTYTDFLKGQSVAEQQKILGVGKQKLFSEGKINLTDLINQSGRPLSLAQIEAQL